MLSEAKKITAAGVITDTEEYHTTMNQVVTQVKFLTSLISYQKMTDIMQQKSDHRMFAVLGSSTFGISSEFIKNSFPQLLGRCSVFI